MKVMKGEDTQLAYGFETTWGGSPCATVDQWFGYGTEPHTMDESEGYEAIRYVGGANRNIDTILDGAKEYTGTVTINPQRAISFRLALGKSSCAGSPSTTTHTISESGTLPSFDIEDFAGGVAGSYLKRTLVGCTVDSMTLRCAEGEKVEQEINYIAKRGYDLVSDKTSVTAGSDKPYKWEECLLVISGGGVHGNVDSTKEWSWTINNNLDAPNYQDATQYIGQPIPGDRDYEVTATLNATAGSARDWYHKFFKGGSTFNMNIFIFRTSGSDDVNIAMSGCKMMDCDVPLRRSGTIEQTWTVRPENTKIIARDDTVSNGTDAYKA